jgi:valyl-tRNA synthetase
MLYEVLSHKDSGITTDKFNNCIDNFTPSINLKDSNKSFITFYLQPNNHSLPQKPNFSQQSNFLQQPITGQEHKIKKIEEFNRIIAQHKNDFDTLNTLKPPPEISFADNISNSLKISNNDIDNYIRSRDNDQISITRNSTTVKTELEIDEEFNNIKNKLNNLKFEMHELKAIIDEHKKISDKLINDISNINSKIESFKR